KVTFEAGLYNGKELPLVPNQVIKLGAEWYLPAAFVLRPEIRFVSDAYLSGDQDNNGEKLSAYQIYNLFLFYRPVLDRYKISAFIGVENLNDEKYAMIGVEGTAFSPQTYYPMPERTFKCGISFEF
ncbi:MAG: TonB-dependent receptor, partial [Syntrophaceae bacterium]|nr:TonB-dependent receptor [Syntrophaceae bacterium]